MSATRRSQRHASPVATALWAVQHKKFLRAFVERPQAGGYSEIMHGRYRQSLLDMANPRLISQVRRELDFHARPLPTLVSEGRASATSTSPLAVIVDSDVEDGVQNSFACVIRWSHRPVAVKEHSKSLRLDGRQGRGYNRYRFISSLRRRRVCFPAPAAVALAVRNVDCRSSQLSRSPQRLSWQPTWLSSRPRVEHGVPAKDSAFSSPF